MPARNSSLFIFLFLVLSANAYSNVVTYPAQKNDAGLKSDKFLVTVSQNNRPFESFTYISKAGNDHARELYGQQGKTFSYTIFSFSQPVIVEVTKIGSSAQSAVLRPNRLGLGTVNTENVRNGKKVRFTLNQPGKISVEFNDDPSLKDAIMIFADSLEDKTQVPDAAAKNVFLINSDNDIKSIPDNATCVYFPAGVHTIHYWTIPKTITPVYVAGGSFIRGYFYAERDNNSSVIINGRGILSNDIYHFHYPDNDPGENGSSKWYKTITVKGGQGHTIEGLTLVDGSAYNILLAANNTTIENVNINGFKYNNDGITPFGNNNKILNCFIRSNDDAVVLYGNSISIENCVFWQLVNGSIIQLGWRPNKISGANVINNIDVIHAEWNAPNNQNIGFINCMNAYSNNSEGRVENFDIRNIHFDTDILRFVDLRMKRNGKGQPNTFKNFKFDNIYINNQKNEDNTLIFLNGYDENHSVSDISFKNIFLNNKPIDQGSANSKSLIQTETFSIKPAFEKDKN